MQAPQNVVNSEAHRVSTELAFNAIFGAVDNCLPSTTMGELAGASTRYIRSEEDGELANSILDETTNEVVEGVKGIAVKEATDVILDSSLGLVRETASNASENSGELSLDLSDLIIQTPISTPLESLITTINIEYLDRGISVASYDAAAISILS